MIILELIGAAAFTVLAAAYSATTDKGGLELPADPDQQVKVLASHCLTELKTLLVNGEVASVSSGQVVVNGLVVTAEPGRVLAGGRVLASLGPLGSVYFERASATSLKLTIRAELQDAHKHEVQATLSIR